ncbi:MAG: hypothetical protein KGJ06_05680 [Pseudomonadota bacterium]|nr:hypothetical protein [Pseudomonadota bacterium]
MALSARYVVPSQRRHWRVTVPIVIAIGGKDYPSMNWSVSGFRVADITKTVRPGDYIDVYVKIPFHGFDVGFDANARVCRYDGHERELAAEFVNLGEREQETLRTFIQGLTTGEMAPIGGIIKKLDLPVTPATLNPLPNLPEQEALYRRQQGMRLYKWAGAALALALATVIYTNVFQMKIDTAMVTGRNTIITSPASGDITYLAAPNTPVAAGQTLAVMTDPHLDYEMQQASLTMQDAGVEADRLTAMLDLEKKRQKAAENIVSKEWGTASDSVDSLRHNLEVKADSVRRIEQLAKEGFVSQIYLDKVRGDYYDTERQLHAARQEEGRRQEELSTVKAGFQVRDSAVQNGILDTEALRQAALEKVSVAQKQLDFMKEQKSRLTIKAPAEGQLVRVFAPGSSAVKYGDPVAIFEQGGAHVVQAFLTQQEALHVAPGKTANVYFASHWWSVPMKVVDVDYYSMTLGQNHGLFQWQNLQNDQFKTVMVTLEPAGDRAAQALGKIAPGTASSVVFSRFF